MAMPIETQPEGAEIPNAAALTLSDEQRAAVEHDAGPLIVLAGPGTGKTRVITARVAHMIGRGVDPESVLAVTFTNKAAGELRERLGGLLDPYLAERIGASTLHAFGMGLLRRFGDIIGLGSEIEILDPAQLRRLARELIRANGLYRRSIGRGIDHAVDHGLEIAHELVSRGLAPSEAVAKADRLAADLAGDASPEAKARRAELGIFREGAELARLLDAACLERGTPRFDDLITWPMKLMARSGTVRDIVRQRCRHVVVDEFQDLNATQIEMLSWLCPPDSNPDLCVVGDDDQSIYAFRGADERAFDRFATMWQGVRTLELTTNYRSGSGVIDASNAIIAASGYRFAPDKRGRASDNPPEPSSVELVRVSSNERTGPVIAAMIREQLRADPGLDLSTIAVIARTRTDLERAGAAMEMAGIPFVSSAADATDDHPGVKAVLDWARLVVDPTQTWAARSVLTRAPFGCEAAALGVIEQRYRSARASANAGEAEDPGPFIAWACANCPPGDADLAGALRRGAAAEKHIARVASSATADDALMEIIRVTGVAHAVDCSARERALRVRCLVALVRFARRRLARLDEPRDLRALLEYLDDLPAKERDFKPTPEDSLDPPEAFDDAGRPGVRLLTAHASKGLEFDTVYIPRLYGGHGYPSARTSPCAVPEEILEPDPQGRDEKARRMDEERRIFFVALTRAEKRAVLVTQVAKKPSGVSFPFELRTAAGVTLVEHEEIDVAPDHDADGLDALETESGGAAERAAIIASARRAARRDAANALDLAERSDDPDPAFGQRLRRAADRLAMISAVARTGAAPPWAAERGLLDEASELIARLRRGAPEPGVEYGGLSGPLKLSYSRINQYLRCPRCYLLFHVLKLPQRETSKLGVGTAAHAALEHFAKRWRLADSEGVDPPAWTDLERVATEKFHEHWPRTLERDPGELERLQAQMRLYWEQLHDPRDHISEFIESHFEFSVPVDGVTHRISGKIDRIDHHPAGGWRIIDYKTGAPRKELLEPKANDLQMGIYARALESLVGERGTGSTAEYWILSTGERGVIALDDLNHAKIDSQIEEAVRGMASGRWEKGKRCSGDCDFLDDARLAPNPGV